MVFINKFSFSASIMLRKIIAITLSIVFCISFSSCFGSSESDKPVEPDTAKIAFPEGYTIYDIAKKLEDEKVCTAADFLEACKTVPDGYALLLDGASDKNVIFPLEGYVFPDTYEFFIGENAKNALSRFLGNTKSKISSEYFDRAKELGLTMNQVFTLASIIQSECGIKSEMPKVSSVFHNRLAKATTGFPYIGSDVTRLYIEKKMKSYIETKSLDYDTIFGAYCTNDGYDHKTQGLPVGPICNPGMDAINATLWPAETDYLYFFTDPDGGFHYNKTLSDHQSEYKALTK